MPYQIPIEQPLTVTQAELTSKIGAMKNLLSLDTFKKVFNISKKEQISSYDYLLKVTKAIGMDSDSLFRIFITSFLETEFLVKIILKSTAQMFAVGGKNLDPHSSYTSSTTPTEDDKKKLYGINYKYLDTNPLIKIPLVAAVELFKMQLVKNLTTLLFGKPKDATAQNAMHPNPSMLDELVEDSICGTMVFNVSSPARLRNQDLEYNKFELAERLQKGKAEFQVSCMGVEVKMPDSPAYIFGGGNVLGIPSQGITPAQSVDLIINLVSNQIQQQNKETNAPTSGKSFRQSMTEKIVVNIMTLLRPLFIGFNYINPGYNGIIQNLRQVNGDPSITTDNYVSPTNCELLQQFGTDPIDTSDPNNKKTLLSTILCNMVLNFLISIFITQTINQLKKFVAKYFAKKAANKQKRKADKIKAKFNLMSGGLIDQAQTIASLGGLITSLMQPDDNIYA